MTSDKVITSTCPNFIRKGGGFALFFHLIVLCFMLRVCYVCGCFACVCTPSDCGDQKRVLTLLELGAVLWVLGIENHPLEEWTVLNH